MMTDLIRRVRAWSIFRKAHRAFAPPILGNDSPQELRTFAVVRSMSSNERTNSGTEQASNGTQAMREPAAIPQLALRAKFASSWRAGVLLVIISLCVLVPGLFSIPPIDRDESRFAQASRQMIDSGEYVVPMVQDTPRLNKPPLIYWLQSSSARIALAVHGHAGDTGYDAIWMYRLPSAFAAMLSVLLTWRLGLRMLDSRAAFIGAAGFAVSPLLVVDAHQARADQVLVCITIAAMLALWRVLHEIPAAKVRPRTVDAARFAVMSAEAKAAIAAEIGKSAVHSGTRPAWWVLWVLVGLGILAKGPITPMVVVLCVLAHCALQRDWGAWKRAMPGRGMLVACACILPWVLLVMNQVGAVKYASIVIDETLGRSVGPKEGHWGPPGYHLLLLTPLLFPLTLAAGAACVQALKAGLQRPGSDISKSDATANEASNTNKGLVSKLTAWKPWQADRASLFLISWALPSFVVFELVSTKLPHYPLPVYAAIALLAARGTLSMTGTAARGWTRVAYVLWALVGVIGLSASCGALSYLLELPGWAKMTGFAVAGITCVLLLAAGFFSIQGRLLRALLLSAIATALSLSTTLGILFPHATGERSPWIAQSAAQQLLRAERSQRKTLAEERAREEEKRKQDELQKQSQAAQTNSVEEQITETPSVEAEADQVPIAAGDYFEDSLVFLTHGRVKRLGGQTPEETLKNVNLWMDAHPYGLLLCTQQFASRLGNVHSHAALRGFNHPRGVMVDLAVVSRSVPKASVPSAPLRETAP
jgi:4-amino-4-deoxy-L-arabinose transferase-like glycosyltransferase